MLETKKYEIRFRRFGIATIIAVFFLIFVGGLVRSTGSGMGCPDWPKCFGQYVPPTNINQLPVDYKTKFAVQGKQIADFDVYKTWIEYLNRLVGVVIGLFILLTVVFAFPYLKSNPKIFWLSFLAFILVGFQGWIGSKVVASDLATWMITIHMLIALLIVALLIFTVTNSQEFSIIQFKSDSSLKLFIIIALIISLIQIVSGTQVREKVDHVANLLGEQYRTQWPKFFMEELIFKLHRSWSILSLLISTLLLFKYRSLFERSSLIYKCGLGIILLLCSQALSGSILVNLGFPKQVTSIHLTVGSIIAGLQILVAILIFNKTKLITE
ncbi:MAG: COX15/CtaA family protein [Bacteroidia bacterium]|jgi:cytochrome c oxidase assembly protein subunit 15